MSAKALKMLDGKDDAAEGDGGMATSFGASSVKPAKKPVPKPKELSIDGAGVVSSNGGEGEDEASS